MEGSIVSERLVVVSNRVAVATDKKAQTGGLAVALQDALKVHGGIWFGWSGKTKSRTAMSPKITQAGNVEFATLDLGKADFDDYYNGYANRALWPLFHYRLDLTNFTNQNYAGYFRVNSMFASKLAPMLKPDDLVWIHDYHMIPLAEELRRAGINSRIGFFLHTPFPAAEILTALPSHANLVRSLCAYDLVGFQTENDLRSFQDYIRHEAHGTIGENGVISAYGRTLVAKVFPIGIDTEEFAHAAQHAARNTEVRRLRESRRERTLMIGVDRLDYSKGLVERFDAFALMLDRYPSERGAVSLLQIAPPTRSEVPEYQDIRTELETHAGGINGRFAEFDWMPIRYLNKSYNRNTLAGFFRESRVGLVTPLRDGMNLVAKEYVAAQNPLDPGVLVLSRFAGAARELSSALIVNPFDLDGTAEAMARALSMPLEERIERWRDMMAVISGNTLSDWRDSFISDLKAVKR
jgi:trehalose 6-phosphate synthase